MKRWVIETACVTAGALLLIAAAVAKGVLLAAVGAVLIIIAAVDAICCTSDLERLINNAAEKKEQRDRCLFSLGQRFEAELDKGEIALKESYSAGMMDKQLRISALQSQINPHFLYNTLECIRSEALMQGCGNIAEMSRALAAFFRYSISRKEDIVSLEDELDNINNYFLIQKFRFDDRFNLLLDTETGDEDVMECLIPKMTVQPIVENCIFHGLEPKAGSGSVTISVKTTEDKIILTISDDGIGMTPEQLLEIRSRLQCDTDKNTPDAKRHGSRIALRNVDQRIKLAFGAQYGINVYSTKGIGTDVEIVFPIEKKLGGA